MTILYPCRSSQCSEEHTFKYKQHQHQQRRRDVQPSAQSNTLGATHSPTAPASGPFQLEQQASAGPWRHIMDTSDVQHRPAFQTSPGRRWPSYSLRFRPNRGGDTRLMLLRSREPFKRYIALSCRMAMHTSMYVHETKLHGGAGGQSTFRCSQTLLCCAAAAAASSGSERRSVCLSTFAPSLSCRAPKLRVCTPTISLL